MSTVRVLGRVLLAALRWVGARAVNEVAAPVQGWVAEETLPAHVRRALLPGERLVVAQRRHLAHLFEPVGTVLGALLLLGWLDRELPAGAGAVRELGTWLVLGLGVRLGWRVWDHRYEWFVASDRRLLLLHGLVTRQRSMMPLTKVTDMSFNRSPVGSVLGYGQFVLESAGQDQALRTVDWVRSPETTYRVICEQIFSKPAVARAVARATDLDTALALPFWARPASAAPTSAAPTADDPPATD